MRVLACMTPRRLRLSSWCACTYMLITTTGPMTAGCARICAQCATSPRAASAAAAVDPLLSPPTAAHVPLGWLRMSGLRALQGEQDTSVGVLVAVEAPLMSALLRSARGVRPLHLKFFSTLFMFCS